MSNRSIIARVTATVKTDGALVDIDACCTYNGYDMNIILIVIDTLRASRLGCYGYPLPTSPAIDRLAAEGARFEQAFAPGIPTTPAHTTLFTGMHPLHHNVVCHGGQVDLDRRIPVLAELLQRAGYTTSAVDNLFHIKPWFARGFEYYINPASRRRLQMMVSCEEINDRAISWLRVHSSEKFFLFLHYWEPHTPYMPPERYRTFYPSDRDPFAPEHRSFAPIRRQPFWSMFRDIWFDKLGPVTDAEYIASLYDAEIRHVDDGIANLLQALDELGLAEDSLVVLTGDHGESMFQHDIYFDHHGLYDDIIHVPLLMRRPSFIPSSRALPSMVQHCDVAPTLLEAAGCPIPAQMGGRSLWNLATGKSDQGGWDRVYACESTWQAKWAVRTPDRKLIVAREQDHHNMPPRELYDLAADPQETVNLAIERWEEAAELEQDLESWIAKGLEMAGRSEDPIRAQGVTLGKRWLDSRS